MTKTPLEIRRLEISKEYRNTKVKDDELIKKTSRQILNVFDKIPQFTIKRLYEITCYKGMWRGKHYHKIGTQPLNHLQLSFY
jgi:hypothetical protein